MKKLLLTIALMVGSLSGYAYNPTLTPAMNNVESCLTSDKVLLCNDEILPIIKGLSMDVRGEFAMYLREQAKANYSAEVIKNLYTKLQVIIPIYEQIDTCDQWSCREIKNVYDNIAVEYVKVVSINKDFLISLYKNQATQGGRYNLLTTISNKIDSLKSIDEMEALIKFSEFAKDYSKKVNDEFYLYTTAVDMIRRTTIKELAIRPGHEGIYSVTFDDPEMAKTLNVDKVVVMESNGRDSLVVNFVSSTTRIVKISFVGSGILGDVIFSNEDVYNNDQNTSNPYFKFTLNRETKTIKGVFSTARYGAMNFSGSQSASNLSVFSQTTVKGLSIEALVGTYSVKVGATEMKLVLRKRTEDRVNYEAALFNDNAMISFSKVSFDSDKGVLSLVDSNNERKLTLAITDFSDKATLSVQFLNAPQAKALEIKSL